MVNLSPPNMPIQNSELSLPLILLVSDLRHFSVREPEWGMRQVWVVRDPDTLFAHAHAVCPAPNQRPFSLILITGH